MQNSQVHSQIKRPPVSFFHLSPPREKNQRLKDYLCRIGTGLCTEIKTNRQRRSFRRQRRQRSSDTDTFARPCFSRTEHMYFGRQQELEQRRLTH